jgi:hypothetical protein
MIVGHNPMIEEFFHRLVGKEIAETAAPFGYPTAGLAILDFDERPSEDRLCRRLPCRLHDTAPGALRRSAIPRGRLLIFGIALAQNRCRFLRDMVCVKRRPLFPPDFVSYIAFDAGKRPCPLA